MFAHVAQVLCCSSLQIPASLCWCARAVKFKQVWYWQVRASVRRGVKDIITRVGVTTVIVTHDQEEAFDIADRVVIFNRYGTPWPDIDELWEGLYVQPVKGCHSHLCCS